MKKITISRSLSSVPSQQKGFIQGAILFGIALLTAVIGGFAMANRTPTSQTSTEQAKVNASVFLKQGADISEGVARFAFDGGNVSSMTFSSSTGGLFEPAKQYALVQRGPSAAYGGSAPVNSDNYQAGSYALNTAVKVPSVGTSGYGIAVSTVFADLGTCRRINNMLYGRSITLDPPVYNVDASIWIGGDDGIDLTGIGAITGWTEGCLTTGTSGNYVYFKVVKEG